MKNNLNKYGEVFEDSKNGNIYIHLKNELDIYFVYNEIKSQINSGYEIKITDIEKRIITLYKITKLADMPEEFKVWLAKGLADGSIVLS